MLASSLFLLGFLPTGTPVAATPSAGLASDSFSQEAGDCYIWEYMLNLNMTAYIQTGSREKIDVTVVNSTPSGPVSLDAVYGTISTYTPLSGVWSPSSPEMPMMMYFSYMGFVFALGMYPNIMPHNQVAINKTLAENSSFYFGFGTTFVWNKTTSGPNGYDGTYELWNGSADGTGALYEKKVSLKYNAEGVCEFLRWYNGTGTDWELTDEMVLQTPLKPVLQVPVVANATSINVTLTWNTVTNATSYYVYRSTAPVTQMSVKTMVPLINTTSTTYCDLTVPHNTTSYYGVVAGNAVANSSISVNQLVNLTSSAGSTEPTPPGISGFVPAVFVTSFAILVVIWRKRKKSLAF